MIDGLALVGELRQVGWREREDAVWVLSTLGVGPEEMPAVIRSCLSWSVVRLFPYLSVVSRLTLSRVDGASAG